MNSDFLFRLFKILRGRTFNMERRKQPTCEDCLWCYDWCMHDPPACFEKEIHDMVTPLICQTVACRGLRKSRAKNLIR